MEEVLVVRTFECPVRGFRIGGCLYDAFWKAYDLSIVKVIFSRKTLE
jgi:hypothetical protein